MSTLFESSLSGVGLGFKVAWYGFVDMVGIWTKTDGMVGVWPNMGGIG